MFSAFLNVYVIRNEIGRRYHIIPIRRIVDTDNNNNNNNKSYYLCDSCYDTSLRMTYDDDDLQKRDGVRYIDFPASKVNCNTIDTSHVECARIIPNLNHPKTGPGPPPHFRIRYTDCTTRITLRTRRVCERCGSYKRVITCATTVRFSFSVVNVVLRAEVSLLFFGSHPHLSYVPGTSGFEFVFLFFRFLPGKSPEWFSPTSSAPKTLHGLDKSNRNIKRVLRICDRRTAENVRVFAPFRPLDEFIRTRYRVVVHAVLIRLIKINVQYVSRAT